MCTLFKGSWNQIYRLDGFCTRGVSTELFIWGLLKWFWSHCILSQSFFIPSIVPALLISLSCRVLVIARATCFNTTNFCSLTIRVHSCVSYSSENKQWSISQTTLTCKSEMNVQYVFCEAITESLKVSRWMSAFKELLH